MTLALIAAFALAAAPRPAAAPASVDCGALSGRYYADAKQAFQDLLVANPLVIGVGEYHEVEGRGRKVKSAIKRFSEQLLPLLKGRAGHLVAETWFVQGNCGKTEERAVKQIEKETQRPAQTEDEVATMLGHASDLGIAPHILQVDCEDYQDVMGADGAVDDVKLLKLVTRLMKEKASDLLEREEKSGKAVVLYGGALHNELSPSEDLKDFSFATSLQKESGGRYLQLTLLVPEYVEAAGAEDESWFECVKQHASNKQVLLLRRGDSAYLVFPRTPTNKRP